VLRSRTEAQCSKCFVGPTHNKQFMASFIGVRDGGVNGVMQKIRDKVFFAQIWCTIRAFSGKSVKFGNFVNFSYLNFPAKMSSPQFDRAPTPMVTVWLTLYTCKGEFMNSFWVQIHLLFDKLSLLCVLTPLTFCALMALTFYIIILFLLHHCLLFYRCFMQSNDELINFNPKTLL